MTGVQTCDHPIYLTRLGIKRGRWLRDYVYEFIATFAPPLTREAVKQALDAAPKDPTDL